MSDVGMRELNCPGCSRRIGSSQNRDLADWPVWQSFTDRLGSKVRVHPTAKRSLTFISD